MAEFIGPIEEKSSKRSLDDIVASVVGKREDRPDPGIAGMRPQMAPRSRGVDKYESTLFNSAALNSAKVVLYSASAGDKETQKHIYSIFNEKVNFVLKNNITGLEKDIAEKLDFKHPVRLDENSMLQILIDTYDALPNNIKIKVDASSNLAKDMSLATAIQGTNFGLAHNSDTQEISAYYTTEVGSDNNPIRITNMFTKNNIDNYTLREMGFAQGEGAPFQAPRFKDFQGFKNGFELYEDALEQYRKDVKQWRFENPEAKNWTLDLKAVPEANFEGAYTKFKIENLSGVAKYETEGDETVQKIDTSYLISNPILKDQPIEFTSKYLKQDEGGETEFGMDVPIIDGVSLYGKKYDGDWEDTTGYGLKVDKSGAVFNKDKINKITNTLKYYDSLDSLTADQERDYNFKLEELIALNKNNLMYNFTANIDQDKKFNVGLGLNKEITGLPGSTVGLDTSYGSGDEWNVMAGIKIPWGDSKKYKKRKSPINYEKSLIGGHVWQDGELVEKSELEQLQDQQDYYNWLAYKEANPDYELGETFGTSNAAEAFEFAEEKKILPEVDLVDDKVIFKPKYYAKGGRVRMASGGIVNLLKL